MPYRALTHGRVNNPILDKNGNVFVATTQFAREANDSPNVGHGHHWFGNAESYFLIGDALGKALLKLNGK